MKKIVLIIKKPKIRKFWNRNPATKIKQSSKIYDRNKKDEI